MQFPERLGNTPLTISNNIGMFLMFPEKPCTNRDSDLNYIDPL